MLTPVRSSRFKRDVKKAEQRGKQMGKLRDVIDLLLREQPLPQAYQDHPLKGSWKRHRGAHIEPDWILAYRIEGNDLHLTRTGTHADLFDL
jgi:mRNA interferase YafQ